MARKPKIVLQDTEPRSLRFVVADPEWVEPEVSAYEASEEATPKYPTVILRGYGFHTVGVNGVMMDFKGGEPYTVPENIYRILKEADLIISEE